MPLGQGGQRAGGADIVELTHRKGQLQPDHRRRVIHQFQGLTKMRAKVVEPALGQAQGMPAHSGLCVAKSGDQHLVVQLADGLECVQRVYRPGGVLRVCGPLGQAWQRFDRLGFVAFRQKPTGGLATPKAVAEQFAAKRGIIELGQIGRLRFRHVVVNQTPDAAVVAAVVEPVLLLQIARNRRVILDDFTVKIGDVNRALRPDGKVNRVKPDVTGREEFRLLLPGGAANVEHYAIAMDHGTVHEVLCRGTGKHLPLQAGECAVGVDERRAGRGEITVRDRLRRAVAVAVIFAEAGIVGTLGAPRVRLAGGEGGVVVGGVAARGSHGDVGVARQVTPRQRRDLYGRCAGGNHEPVAVVVEGEPVRAGVAADRFDRGAVRLDAKTGHRQVHRSGEIGAGDPPALAAVDVNPVVRPPLRLIDPALDHADLEAGEQCLPHLGLAVAVPVREKNDVRRTHRDDPVARRADAEAGWDAVHPGFDAIHHAVAIVIDQFLDCANLLGLSTVHRILVGGDPADDAVEFTGLV